MIRQNKPNPDIHEVTYARLVAEYAQSLADKLAVLDEAMRRARCAPDVGHSPGLADAREVAHRLRGTAGCYGFRDVSEAAGTLDEVLTALQRGEGSWGAAEDAAELVRAAAEAVLRR